MDRPLPSAAVLLIILCFVTLAAAQEKPAPPPPNFQFPISNLPPDEAALKAVVEQVFGAWQKRDLEAYMALWSEKSPGLATRRQAMRQIFGQDDYTFANLAISRLKVEGEKATLRAAVDATITDAKTKGSRKERLIRNLVLVNEAGGWKVWRHAPAVDDLAEALLAAETEEARKALLAAEKELVTAGLARALIARGNQSYDVGDYPGARAAYQLAQPTAEQIGDTPDLARALGSMGNVHQSQGGYPEALEYYRKSLALFEALGDQAGIGATLNNIGAVHRSQGEYGKALDYYQRSLALKEAVGDRAGIARTLLNIGAVHSSQGEYAKALEFIQKSLTIKETLGDRAGIASSLLGIGNVHQAQGEHAKALEYYQKSLALREVLGDRAGIASALLGIGNVNRSQGEYATALDYYQKSLALKEVLGDRAGIASALNGIGLAHEAQGEYATALEYYQKSLAIFETLGDRDGAAATRINIGSVHFHQRHYAEALDDCRKGLALADAVGKHKWSANALAGMGRVHRAQGNRQEAITAFRRAIDYEESIRAQVAGGEEEGLTYLSRQATLDAYEGLVELLVEQGSVQEALATLEQAKRRHLLDRLRLTSLAIPNPALRQLLARVEELGRALAAQEKARQAEASRPEERQDRTRLANLTRLVGSTRAELEQVRSQAVAIDPDCERFLKPGTPDIAAIQRQLPEGTLVMEYGLGEERLLLFLVTRHTLRVETVRVSRERVAELVKEVHAELRLQRARARDGVPEWHWSAERARRLREALAALHGYLIGPARREVAHAKTLVVVPSGILHYLPFAALARPHPLIPPPRAWREGTRTLPPGLGGRGGATLRFLIEDKPLAVLPSLQLWGRIALRESPTPNPLPTTPQAKYPMPNTQRGRLAAFGNPDGTLPGAEQEVRHVGRLFPGSLIFTGSQATRKQVESLPPEVRIAHFATHGALIEQDVNQCCLLLAGGERLMLGDLYGLAGRYPARLTVLSACDTAVGSRDPGIEVAHLAAGFVEAGSTSIVASLWSVDDASTARLMERFYRALREGSGSGAFWAVQGSGGVTLAEALRQAEIALLKDPQTAHPFFWAAFILIGDPRW
jgi:CHAT domain-containing protein/Tfp pilus assembly protein PilF